VLKVVLRSTAAFALAGGLGYGNGYLAGHGIGWFLAAVPLGSMLIGWASALLHGYGSTERSDPSGAVMACAGLAVFCMAFAVPLAHLTFGERPVMAEVVRVGTESDEDGQYPVAYVRDPRTGRELGRVLLLQVHHPEVGDRVEVLADASGWFAPLGNRAYLREAAVAASAAAGLCLLIGWALGIRDARNRRPEPAR